MKVYPSLVFGELSDKATAIKDEQRFFQAKRELQNTIQITKDIKKLNFSGEEERAKLQNTIIIQN